MYSGLHKVWLYIFIKSLKISPNTLCFSPFAPSCHATMTAWCFYFMSACVFGRMVYLVPGTRYAASNPDYSYCSKCLFYKKYFKDVSRKLDEFLVNTHLCKLRCWYSTCNIPCGWVFSWWEGSYSFVSKIYTRCMYFLMNIFRTSAVSSTNFGSILIFASCVVGTCYIRYGWVLYWEGSWLKIYMIQNALFLFCTWSRAPVFFFPTPHVQLFNFEPPDTGGGGTWHRPRLKTPF